MERRSLWAYRNRKRLYAAMEILFHDSEKEKEEKKYEEARN